MSVLSNSEPATCRKSSGVDFNGQLAISAYITIVYIYIYFLLYFVVPALTELSSAYLIN